MHDDLLPIRSLGASFGRFSHLPPSIFGSDRAEIRRSVAAALALDLEGVLPSHCDRASPEAHLARLAAIGRKLRVQEG